RMLFGKSIVGQEKAKIAARRRRDRKEKRLAGGPVMVDAVSATQHHLVIRPGQLLCNTQARIQGILADAVQAVVVAELDHACRNGTAVIVGNGRTCKSAARRWIPVRF